MKISIEAFLKKRNAGLYIGIIVMFFIFVCLFLAVLLSAYIFGSEQVADILENPITLILEILVLLGIAAFIDPRERRVKDGSY